MPTTDRQAGPSRDADVSIPAMISIPATRWMAQIKPRQNVTYAWYALTCVQRRSAFTNATETSMEVMGGSARRSASEL